MAITAAGRSLLRRPALEARLDESFGRRLTLVVAGAGYGKSTLVGQWTEELESAWHTISAGDRQLSTFANNLTKALRPWLEELPDQFQTALTGGQDELVQAEAIAGHLCEALGSTLAHDLVLVVDDGHELSTSTPSLRLIESLCRQAPATVHLVVLSRETLDLRVDRLRAQGLVLELTSRDLAFSSAEVRELSQALLGADDDVAERVEALTEGWPAAIRLALEALTDVPPDELHEALERSNRPGTPLFTYLAREVFERESPEVRELIRAVAPLERFTLELCAALGVAHASETVSGLVRRGLFVRRRGDSLEVHALAREFARSAWPLTDEEERSVHRRAAEWLESESRIGEALDANAAASEDGAIARLLATYGWPLIGAGAAQTVVDMASALPDALRTAEIEQLLGEALVVRGSPKAAIECYERAASKAGAVGSGLAWRMGVAERFRGSHGEALEFFCQALDEVGDTPDDAILLAWTASALWLRGNLADARPLAWQALDIARRCTDDRALAAAYVAVETALAGDNRHTETEGLLDAALEAAKRCGDLVQLGRIRVNRAARLAARGAYARALEEVDEAFVLAEVSGLNFPVRALTNRAGIHRYLGLLDEAYADYSDVIDLSREREINERRYGYLGLGDIHRERGNVVLARSEYERALRMAADGDETHGLAMSLIGLASVLVDEDPQRARQLSGQALDIQWHHHAWALNCAGWVALALGERQDASALAAEAVSAARAGEDMFAVAEALELQTFAGEDVTRDSSRLEEARTIWRELQSRVRLAGCELALARLGSGPGASAGQDRALGTLRALGVRVSAAGPAGLLRTIAQAPPEPLVVQVLGGFRVLREGVPVPGSAWQSKRARDLLKILVSRRGRPVPRDVLMEALWPEENADKLANRLSVALSTLRSVLDPNGSFDPEHFVKADRESVILDLNAVVVDVEVFLHEAEMGLALRAEGRSAEAREWLAQAESAYTGEALEDDLYSDWAVSLREEGLATYGSVAYALAEDAGAAGDDEAAARYLLRILGHDSFDERAHLAYVAALERSGRRGRAREAYRSYVARMEEIGATPAAFPDAGLKKS